MTDQPTREERRLTEYPFPLDDGTTAFLRLPKTGITENESARLQEFIYALVVNKLVEVTDDE
jgi:hypothetical protein